MLYFPFEAYMLVFIWICSDFIRVCLPIKTSLDTDSPCTESPQTETTLGQRPPDRDPLLTETPLDRDFPWTKTPWTETSGQRLPLD